MKIPKKIKIGPHTFEVKLDEGLNDRHAVVGNALSSRGTIVIDPAQSQTQLEDTLLHEILHMMNDQIRVFDKDDEEDAVSRMAPLLLQVIKDNPEFFHV